MRGERCSYGWRARAPVHQQGHAAARTDRRHLAGSQLVAGLQLEVETLEERGRDRLHLELAEPHPDADPGSATERHVRTPRERRFRLGGETLGAELARLREHVREMVRDPRAVVDVGPAGDLSCRRTRTSRSTCERQSRPAGTSATSRPGPSRVARAAPLVSTAASGARHRERRPARPAVPRRHPDGAPARRT